MLKITPENARVGNRAMASVLLLYYHLMLEGGITNDQTAYIASEDFNALDFVDVEVEDGLDIDQKLIREGGCLSLLCHLNDWIGEYETDYLSQPKVKELLESLNSRDEETVPELSALLALVSQGEEKLDPNSYKVGLTLLFEKYVAIKWRSVGMAGEANYAIKPTPELFLRSNRALLLARIIAALGVKSRVIGVDKHEGWKDRPCPWVHASIGGLGIHTDGPSIGPRRARWVTPVFGDRCHNYLGRGACGLALSRFQKIRLVEFLDRSNSSNRANPWFFGLSLYLG